MGTDHRIGEAVGHFEPRAQRIGERMAGRGIDRPETKAPVERSHGKSGPGLDIAAISHRSRQIMPDKANAFARIKVDQRMGAATGKGLDTVGQRVDPGRGAADDQLLDLRGALVQRGDAGVAQVALDRVVVDVAGAAVDLDRQVRALDRGLRGKELGARGLGRVRLLCGASRPAAFRQIGAVKAGARTQDLDFCRFNSLVGIAAQGFSGHGCLG